MTDFPTCPRNRGNRDLYRLEYKMVPQRSEYSCLYCSGRDLNGGSIVRVCVQGGLHSVDGTNSMVSSTVVW